MCTKNNKKYGRGRHYNNRFHSSCTWRFFDMLMGTVSVVGATVGWSEASDAPFFSGRSMPGALAVDRRANNAQARRWAHDKWEHEGKKSGRGGSKTGSGVAVRWGERTRGEEGCNDVEERQSNERWRREMSIQLKVWLEKLALISDCNRTLFLISSPSRRAERAGWLFTARADFAKWIRAISSSRSIFFTRPLLKIP